MKTIKVINEIPHEKGLRVAGKGVPEAVDLGDVSKPSQRKAECPGEKASPCIGGRSHSMQRYT
jgi:hypothetical protein